MKNEQAPVWVIAEQVDCRVLSVSFQLIGQARKLADALDTTVESVILGDHIEDQAQQLIAAGADKVYMGLSPQLEFYQSDIYTEIIVKLAKKRLPAIMLIGSTSMGRELAPLIAARLQTGLTAHCIDLVLDADNVLEAKIPAYGGLLSIICPQRRPQMATVAQGVFPTPDLDENRTGAVIPLDIISDIPQRIQTLAVIREASDGIPLESAPIVVAGGAGAGDKEGWNKIAELAGTLNA
ncbi:MAG: electron transfer flavoprotein subunit alpha/FixB family protein, partial [Desulfobacterales bacterium]